MKRYVLGVASTVAGRFVVILKATPDWQRGLYNFPGGKIEPGETPYDAMRREWKEEVGQHIRRADWEVFAVLREEGVFEVVCLRTLTDAEPEPMKMVGVSCEPVEPINLFEPHEIAAMAYGGEAIENLGWILCLAMDREKRRNAVVVTYGAPLRETSDDSEAG